MLYEWKLKIAYILSSESFRLFLDTPYSTLTSPLLVAGILKSMKQTY
ncbi:hypothetical protein S7335_3463 [Synechococcus sp. PCC 7335]|nr:hypothetical protein S7335_3463 [Synechococcus sp. PCC 7335]